MGVAGERQVIRVLSAENERSDQLADTVIPKGHVHCNSSIIKGDSCSFNAIN